MPVLIAHRGSHSADRTVDDINVPGTSWLRVDHQTGLECSLAKLQSLVLDLDLFDTSLEIHGHFLASTHDPRHPVLGTAFAMATVVSHGPSAMRLTSQPPCTFRDRSHSFGVTMSQSCLVGVT